MPPPGRDGYTFPPPPPISHHRRAREAPGHSARLRRVRARVGRAAHAETALAVTTEDEQAAVTRGTAAERTVARGGTGR